MINFFSTENTSGVISTTTNNDWPIITHLNLYNDFFETWNNHFNSFFDSQDQYIADTNNPTCDEVVTYESFKEIFQNKLPELLRDMTTASTSIEQPDPLRTTSNPSFGTNSGVFGKLVQVLDTGSENFMSNYSMAKTLQKYECYYLEIFRFLIQIQGSIKSGAIMGYFDNIYTELKNGTQALYYYIQTDTSIPETPVSRNECQKLDALAFALTNTYTHDSIEYPAFNTVFEDYKYNLGVGFDDLDTLLTAFSSFYDELYLGVKVISAINMVFYSDPQDMNMIRSEGASNFSFLAMDMESTTDTPTTQLKARTLMAISIAIPMTLDSMMYIDETRSNINTILAQLVHNVFSVLGVQAKLDNMRTVLESQGGLV